MAYKTKPKNTSRRSNGRKRAQLKLKTPNTIVTSKNTILYKDTIRKEILMSNEIVKAMIEEIRNSNIIETIFEKAGYVPIINVPNKKKAKSRNFKSQADRDKAREHIISRNAEKYGDNIASAGIVEGKNGKKRQNRRFVKGLPQVVWDIGETVNAGRKGLVIFTDDVGVSFQEAELGKIGPKMKRRSKRTKKPEDGV